MRTAPAFFLSALLLGCGSAFAFDASKVPSPNYNRMGVDRLTIQGGGSTGDVSGMSVQPPNAPAAPLSDLLKNMPRVGSDGTVSILNGPALGTFSNGKFTSRPGALVLPPSDQGSSGDVSGMSVAPSASAPDGTLAKRLHTPTFGGPVTAPSITLGGAGSTGPVDGMSVLNRTLAIRAQDEINAFDNGVVCDGVTDNAAALATIQGKLAPGKTVYFPPAALPCMTTGRLSVTVSNVVIRANPGTVTLKQAPGNTAPVVLLSVSNASNVLIDGLSFDGGGSNLGTIRNVVQAFNGNNIVFDRISVANTRGIGVLISQSKYSGVRRSTFANIGNYWRTTSAASDRLQGVAFCCNESGKTKADYPGNFVTDSSFTDIGLDAISMGGGVNVVVSGNRCEMANPNQIAQVTASAYSACVYTSQIDGATISNNYSYGATGNAIDVSSTTGYTVTGNYIMESGQSGIGAYGNYGTVSGNTVLNSVRWAGSPYKGGISIGSVPGNQSVGVTITGNLISDTKATPTQPFGIHGYIHGSNDGCTSCLISNNQIGPMATSAYGGYLTGPSVLPASAGGTGLSGGAWAPWTPTFTAIGGADVTFAPVTASYEQTGKTLRGRVSVSVNYTDAPTEFAFTLPGGQSFASGGAIGNGSNISRGRAVQVVSGPGIFTVKPTAPGATWLQVSGDYIVISFEAQVQ